MAYQSPGVLFGSRAGAGSILVRLGGSRTEARPGTENESAQRVKVGISPCCTKATHIAAPARYAVGESPNETSRGLPRRITNDPWAARRYTACIYAQPRGYPPRHWNWAAQSPYMPAPPLFENLLESVQAEPQTPQSTPNENEPLGENAQLEKGSPKQPVTVVASEKKVAPPSLDLPIRYRAPRCRLGGASSSGNPRPGRQDAQWCQGCIGKRPLSATHRKTPRRSPGER